VVSKLTGEASPVRKHPLGKLCHRLDLVIEHKIKKARIVDVLLIIIPPPPLFSSFFTGRSQAFSFDSFQTLITIRMVPANSVMVAITKRTKLPLLPLILNPVYDFPGYTPFKGRRAGEIAGGKNSSEYCHTGRTNHT